MTSAGSTVLVVAVYVLTNLAYYAAAVGGAIVASTLTTCVVFLPVLYVTWEGRREGAGATARLVAASAE